MVGPFRIFALSICTLAFSGQVFAQQGAPTVINDEIIVKMRYVSKSNPNYAFVGKATAQKGLQLKKSWNGMGMYHFKMKKGQKLEDTLADIRNDPDVEYAEPNYSFSKFTIGDVQVLSSAEVVQAASGGYAATGAPIQAPDTWPHTSPSSIPIVAIIDTGLDTAHPVFVNSGAVWTNSAEIPGNGIDDDHNGYIDDVHGFNFVANNGTMIDDDGHGTHVAGTVLAVTEDIFVSPVTSIAPALIRIMPLKFLDSHGSGKTSDAIEAIYYAVANGATVINNSWGGSSYSAALHEAVTYAYSQGVIFVAAAGNAGLNNDSTPMYPASYNVPNVIAVAATTDYDNLASFSNYGKSSVLIGSPGSAILSTYPGGSFAVMYGTSMASPFVAGTAALMKAEQPALLGYQAKQLLADAADSKSTLNSKVNSSGRLNVLSSVTLAQGASIDSSQPAYSFSNQDRSLASSMTSSGCGLVSKLYSDSNKGGPGSSTGTETWYILLVVALFAIPMMVWTRMRSLQPESRRAHERFAINTEVKVSIGERELVASVSSISLGGVQLNTDQLIEQGGIVHMSIRSPDGQEQIQVEGRVVWSEDKKSYGVAFQQAGEPALSRISNWTKALNKA